MCPRPSSPPGNTRSRKLSAPQRQALGATTSALQTLPCAELRGCSTQPAVTGSTPPVQTRPAHWTPQGRTLRPRQRHRRHPPLPPAHPKPGSDRPARQDPGLRAAHRPPHRMPELPQDPPGTAAERAPGGRNGLDGQRTRLHHPEGQAARPRLPAPPLPPPPPQRRTPDDPLPRPPTLDRHPAPGAGDRPRCDQGTPRPRPHWRHRWRLRHVRLRLQRQAIDTLGSILGSKAAGQ